MKNKRSILILLIFVILLSVFVFAITYSFFSAQINNENIANVSANTASGSYVFTVYSEDSIDYYVTTDLMSGANVSTEAIASDNASLLITLGSPDSNTTALCTYDLVWQWTSDNKYTESTTSLPLVYNEISYPFEFSILANKIISPGTDTSGYTYTDGNVIETDVSSFDLIDENKFILVKGAQIASRSKDQTKITWDIRSNLYNIPSVQNSLGGNEYHSIIYVDNVDCELFEITP